MVYSATQGQEQLNRMGAQNIPTFFLIDYSAQRWFVSPLATLHSWNLGFNFHRPSIPENSRSHFREGNWHNKNSTPETVRISHTRLPSRQDYLRGFEFIQNQQRMGNSFLCNLTFPSRIDLSTDQPHSKAQPHELLYRVFQQTRAECRLLVLDPRITNKPFCVFSPEGFVSIRDAIIDSKPMKGTRLALPDRNVQSELAALMADNKEDAEHRTIVDLIRNDLGIISQRVWVDSYRYAQQIHVPKGILWATSSRICGQLQEDWRSEIGTTLGALLPAGSITGAPKKETCRIIEHAEVDQRGYYTGVAGVLGPWGLDSWVLIRYIEHDGDGFCFRSGGGITIYSKPEDEYAELEAKIALPRG